MMSEAEYARLRALEVNYEAVKDLLKQTTELLNQHSLMIEHIVNHIELDVGLE